MNGMSRSVVKFKSGNSIHIATWAEVAKVSMVKVGLQKEDILVRGLSVLLHKKTAYWSEAGRNIRRSVKFT